MLLAMHRDRLIAQTNALTACDNPRARLTRICFPERDSLTWIPVQAPVTL